MVTLFWVLTLIGSMIGGFILIFLGLFSSQGAPQQAAAAAIGVGFGVLPYCFARAISELQASSHDAKELLR